MSKKKYLHYPYVEAFDRGDKQKVKAIVLLSSFTTSDRGAALGIANAWHKNSSPTQSCHYVLDESQVYQCVWDNQQAGLGPKDSIQIMLCSEPLEHIQFWDDSSHVGLLDRAASLVAQLSIEYKLPIRYLTFEEMEIWSKTKPSWRRKKGIILNVHGTWPSSSFLSHVQREIEYQKRARKRR